MAGALTNASITPADTTIGVDTNYTIQFDSFSAIGLNENIYVTASGMSGIRSVFGGDNGFSTVNAPATLTQLGTFNTGSEARSQIFAGSVASSTTVSFVIASVTNPTSAGVSPTYTISVGDSGGNIRDSVTISGINFTSGGAPTVTNMIADQSIFEDDGANAVDLDPTASVNTDLNFVFTDDNGENLSFSIVAGHDASIVTASISTNSLILTGLKTGSTDVTVRAADTSMNTVDETFTVNVIGSLTPANVTPTSLLVTQTTDYTLVFSPAVALAGNELVILSGAADFSSATLTSINGGSGLTASIDVANSNGSQVAIQLTGGTAATADAITVVFGNMVNPGAPGMATDYTLRTQFSGVTNGQSNITGSTYVADIFPTVANAIPGQSFNQEDGSITVDLDSSGAVNTDLHFTFVDGDNDPLTFTVEAGHDTNVVTVAIVSDEIILTGQGTGTTTVTIKADDMQDGSVTTSFQVSVLGSISPASVMPSSQFTNVTANYTVSFTPNVTLSAGDRIRFNTTGEHDQTSSALISISGGSLSGSKVSGSTVETAIGIDSGSVSSGTLVTMVLSGIVNPTSAGMGNDYRISTDNGVIITGLSTVSGHNFTIASVNIFADGFEDTVVAKAAINTVALINKLQISNQPTAELDKGMSHYLFMSQSLSITKNDRVRTMDEVLHWFKKVLYSKAPTGDFDFDGISNEFDADPFGIVPN